MEDQKSNPLNFLKVIRFLYRWKITFSIVVFPSAILAYILASPPFTEPLYRSASVFYPTSEGAFSDQVIQPDAVHDNGYLDVGEEERVERFLQILKSEKLKAMMLRRFNLLKHYEIPKDAENRYKKFAKTYKSNFNFSKTQFRAIEAEVFDKNPEKAARMANAVVNIADSLHTEVKQKRAQEAMAVVKDKFEQQKVRAAELADSIKILAEKGLVAFEDQSRKLVENIGKARLQGQGDLVKDLEKQLDIVGKFGPVYHGLIEQLTYVNEQIAIHYNTYQRIKSDAEERFTDVYVMDKAKPSSDDAKPNKPLIVGIALIASFLITVLVLRSYERWHIFKKEITGQT